MCFFLYHQQQQHSYCFLSVPVTVRVWCAGGCGPVRQASRGAWTVRGGVAQHQQAQDSSLAICTGKQAEAEGGAAWPGTHTAWHCRGPAQCAICRHSGDPRWLAAVSAVSGLTVGQLRFKCANHTRANELQKQMHASVNTSPKGLQLCQVDAAAYKKTTDVDRSWCPLETRCSHPMMPGDKVSPMAMGLSA